MNLVPAYAATASDLERSRQYLEMAIKHICWDIEGVLDAIARGQVLLIKCEDGGQLLGAGVVNIEHDIDHRRALVVHLFGSESGVGWEALFEPLQAFARDLGCDCVRGFGRPGWARKLGAKPIHGWEVDIHD
jgi:hypothetical protein